MNLTEAQWERVAPLIPSMRSGPGKRGRPARNARDVLNGILWILRTGAQWRELPGHFPPYQTCHRRFQQWQREEVFEQILTALAEDLRERGQIDLTEGFIDGTFARAKKGAVTSGRPKAARAARSWPLQTALVFLSPCTWPALRRMRVPSSMQPSTLLGPNTCPSA